jgi:hypothetical protein
MSNANSDSSIEFYAKNHVRTDTAKGIFRAASDGEEAEKKNNPEKWW